MPQAAVPLADCARRDLRLGPQPEVAKVHDVRHTRIVYRRAREPPTGRCRRFRGGIIQDSACSTVWAESLKNALTRAHHRSPLGLHCIDRQADAANQRITDALGIR